jgi:hypothetical protein
MFGIREGWLDEIDTDLAKDATPSTCASKDHSQTQPQPTRRPGRGWSIAS